MTTSYRNPIIPGFNPDPSFIRVRDTFYLVTSSFEYFPGVPIYISKNLIEWELQGHVLSRPSQLTLRNCEPSGGIFAPTLREYNGRFYMTVCSLHRRGMMGGSRNMWMMPRGFYVWTDDITDPSSWSDPIYYDVTGIDQDLFIDDDGKTYLSVAQFNIIMHADGKPAVDLASHVCEIDLATGKQLTPMVRIKGAQPGLQRNDVAEGPHIFKREGYYYLSTAEGGTEGKHQQWISRCKTGPYGPWETGPEGTVNPMICNGDDEYIQQTGHMDLAEGADGQWWAVFLGVRPVRDEETGELLLSPLGRETFLAPAEWKDGWPIVNKHQLITLNGFSSANLSRSPETFVQKFNFCESIDIFKEGWYYLRTPMKIEHDLTARPGSLALWGGPYSLHEAQAITMVAQKQTAFESEWRATLDFEPLIAGSQAGITAFWSQWAFGSLSIRGVAGSHGKIGRELVFTYPDLPGDDFKEDVSPCPDGPLKFLLRTMPNRYAFCIESANGNEKEIGFITSKALARDRQFDSIFTGTMIGLFAHGAKGNSAVVPAFFSDVSVSGKRAGGA